MTNATIDFSELMRSDFSGFIDRSFEELNSSTRFLPNWHIELLADRLEKVRLGLIKRLIINVPPRSLKSHCASIAFPAWLQGHDPSAKIIAVSYAQEFADKLARDSRALMLSPFYKRLFPTRLAGRKAVDEFETTAGGYRLSTSVGGVLTGRGADFIIIDDPLKPEEALSATQRKAVNDWYGSTLFTRLNSKVDGAIVLIMQRLHQDDLVGHVLELGEEWEVLNLPAIAEHDEAYEVESFGEAQILGRKAGDALHPDREPLETLEKLRRQLGTYNFMCQYQQQPMPPEGMMVKPGWFKTFDLNDPPRFDRIVQSWDTANKVSQLTDYSVCTTWGLWQKRYYLLDVFRQRLEFPDLKRMVKNLAELHHASIVLIEDKASGTQLIQDLRRERLSIVQPCQPDADKIMRMHAQTPTIEGGFVFLPKQAHWLDDYIREVTSFPGSKHDDQVDSTAQMLRWSNQPFPGEGILEYYRQCAEAQKQSQNPDAEIRLKAPDATTHVYLIDGSVRMLAADKTIVLPREHALPLLPKGWIIIKDDGTTSRM
jgi:predicted phage terminase large subunit-like protein